MLSTLSPTVLHACSRDAEEVPAPEVNAGVGAVGGLLRFRLVTSGLHAGRGDAGAG